MPENQVVPAEPEATKLDQVMLAMDIVDTLRHEQSQVETELNEEERDRALVARVRRIYEQQGIEVAEEVVAEGVAAMKRERLVFRPPPPSWRVRMAGIWVDRKRWGLGLLLVGALAFVLTKMVGPKSAPRGATEAQSPRSLAEAADQTRREVESILASYGSKVRPPSADPALTRRLVGLENEARDGLARGNPALALTRAQELLSLHEFVAAELEVRILSHATATSGVERTSRDDPRVKLYYLIVESRDQRGNPWPIEVKDEGSGLRKSASQFGIRVPKTVFDRVRADKLDNRIVDDALVGEKRAGEASVRWLVAFEGGMILQW